MYAFMNVYIHKNKDNSPYFQILNAWLVLCIVNLGLKIY